MAKTSSAVKRRYNAKAYKQWNVQLKPELFDRLEAERGALGMSRAEYLDHLAAEKGNRHE
jgi:hypothetical protein